jgi:hypothetical protein
LLFPVGAVSIGTENRGTCASWCRGFAGQHEVKRATPVLETEDGEAAGLVALRNVRTCLPASGNEEPTPAHVLRRSPDDSTVVLSIWQCLGSGYLDPGDVLLAAGVEASLRAACEALLDVRGEPS